MHPSWWIGRRHMALAAKTGVCLRVRANQTERISAARNTREQETAVTVAQFTNHSSATRPPARRIAARHLNSATGPRGAAANLLRRRAARRLRRQRVPPRRAWHQGGQGRRSPSNFTDGPVGVEAATFTSRLIRPGGRDIVDIGKVYQDKRLDAASNQSRRSGVFRRGATTFLRRSRARSRRSRVPLQAHKRGAPTAASRIVVITPGLRALAPPRPLREQQDDIECRLRDRAVLLHDPRGYCCQGRVHVPVQARAPEPSYSAPCGVGTSPDA